MYCKGIIMRIRQCAGCLEVIVEGDQPGAFVIDNCMVPLLLDPDGPGLVGRHIEYADGMMRFLDEQDEAVDTPTSDSTSHSTS